MSTKESGDLGVCAPATVTVREAAKQLGLRIESCYRLLYCGLLSGVLRDGKWEISQASVDDYRLNHARKGKGEGSGVKGTRHENQL